MSDSPTIFSLEDRVAATDIVLRFFDLVDSGRAAEAAALFVADGRMTFGPGTPSPGTIAGAGIAAAMTARQAQTNVTTRHALTNMIASPLGGGAIEVRAILTLYRSDDDGRDSYPRTVADETNLLIRTPQGWRIKDRTVTPVFQRA